MKRYYLLLLMILFPSNVFGAELNIGKDIATKSSVAECEHTEDYLKWLSLSAEEKLEYEMPPACKTASGSKLLSKAASAYRLATTTLPDAYRIDQNNYDVSVKNQEATGSCWAFATNNSIETYILKYYGKTLDLSERHMEYATTRYFSGGVENVEGHNRQPGAGGNFFIASGYLYRGDGTIPETQMPFENNENLISISSIENKTPTVDIKDILVTASYSCDTATKDLIKSHVYKYGSVAVGVYMTEALPYFNSEEYALYYSGTSPMNHLVSIVGWDDDYSVDNFVSTHQPASNGAWVVKNSWGPEWGEAGYFYVSYEDTNICASIGGISDADFTLPDNEYVTTPLGMNNAVGVINDTGTSTIAIKYDKGAEKELLTEVMVASFDYTEIDVYLIADGSKEISLDNATYVGSDVLVNPGYKTVTLDEPQLLEHDSFIVLIQYTSSASAPVGVAQQDSVFWSTLEAQRGIAYMYSGTSGFIDINDFAWSAPVMPVVKLKTDNADYDILSLTGFEKIINNRQGGTFNLELTSKYLNNITLDLAILNSEGEDVTSKFAITNNPIAEDKTTINIGVPAGQVLPVGGYKLVLEHSYLKKEYEFNLYEYRNLSLENVEASEVLYASKQNELRFSLVATNIADNSPVEVLVTDASGADASSYFAITSASLTNNKALIIVKNMTEISPGKYTFKFIAGGYEAQSEITLLEYIPITSLKFSASNIIIGNLKSDPIEYEYSPENANAKELEWSSSDENIVSVQDGKLVAVGSGTAVVTASFVDNPEVRASVSVQAVASKVSVTSLVITPAEGENALYAGTQGSVSAHVTYEDVKNLDVSILNSKGANKTDDFVVETAQGEDFTNLNITLTDNAEAGVYCINALGSYDDYSEHLNNSTCFEVKEVVLVSSITSYNLSLYEGDTQNLMVGVYPDNARNKKVSFTSSDESVALVDEKGRVTALKEGSATITIKAQDGGGVTKHITITVKDCLFKNSPYLNEKGYINNVSTKTSYTSFVGDLNVIGGLTLNIYDTKGKLKTSGYIATGDKIVKNYNGNTSQYYVIIRGDINGDGMHYSNDALLIERSLVSLVKLDAYQKKAADVSQDGRVAANDSLLLKRFLVGLRDSL